MSIFVFIVPNLSWSIRAVVERVSVRGFLVALVFGDLEVVSSSLLGMIAKLREVTGSIANLILQLILVLCVNSSISLPLSKLFHWFSRLSLMLEKLLRVTCHRWSLGGDKSTLMAEMHILILLTLEAKISVGFVKWVITWVEPLLGISWVVHLLWVSHWVIWGTSGIVVCYLSLHLCEYNFVLKIY